MLFRSGEFEVLPGTCLTFCSGSPRLPRVTPSWEKDLHSQPASAPGARPPRGSTASRGLWPPASSFPGRVEVREGALCLLTPALSGYRKMLMFYLKDTCSTKHRIASLLKK